MPISLVCAGCKKKLKVPDIAAGKKIRCPVCQARNTVSKTEEPPPDDDLVEPDEDEEDENSKKDTRVTGSAPKQAPKKKKADDDDLVEPDAEEDEDEDTGYTASEPKPKPKKDKKRSRDDDEDDEDEEVEVERDDDDDRRRRRKKKKRKRYDDFHGNLRGRNQTDHRGVAILITGILSIVVGFACFLPCWILGVVAINMANADIATMENGKMNDAGMGLTKAGLICGYTGIVLGILNCCCGATWRFGLIGGDF